MKQSKLRVVLSVAAPPLLLLMAWGAAVVDAPLLLTAVLGLLAAAFGYVVAFDLPLSVSVDARGIHRLCLLRRHLLPWEDIAGIVQLRKGGLIAVSRNRKRYVLLDRTPEVGELDLLRTEAELRHVKIGF